MTEEYAAGPPAIPEMLAVVDAARAVLVASPHVTPERQRELAAAVEELDRARSGSDVETNPATPSARMRTRSAKGRDSA